MRETANTYTVGFDDTHVMTVDPEVELSERSHVEDPETVSLSGLQRYANTTVSIILTKGENIKLAQTSKGNVAFSLNPTAPVTGSGFVPSIGPRYSVPFAKYITPESARAIC